MERTVRRCSTAEMLKICEKLYKDNPYLSPYQAPQFMDIVGVGRLDSRPFEVNKYKEENYVLYRDGSPVAVAPLLKRSLNNVVLVCIRGEFLHTGHLDFIYSADFTQEDFDFLMDYVFRQFGENIKIKFNRISEKSLSFKYSENYFSDVFKNSDLLKRTVCVSIPLPDNYEEWYNGLSKSVRQNIRTSYNRLTSDGKSVSFNMLIGESPAKKISKDILSLYCKRTNEYHNLKIPFIANVSYKIMCILKKNNPFTKALDKCDNRFCAYLYIDKDISAFCSGFIGNDGRIIIPRLSTERDLGRYSPGGILINEIIKKISNDNTHKIKELDLSRGHEPYKYAYGGVDHYNYAWDAKRRRSNETSGS